MPSKKYLVVWSESAALDLKSIVSFIAVDSVQNARETFEKIKKECLLLERFPDLGKIPVELDALQIGGYRELMRYRLVATANYLSTPGESFTASRLTRL